METGSQKSDQFETAGDIELLLSSDCRSETQTKSVLGLRACHTINLICFPVVGTGLRPLPLSVKYFRDKHRTETFHALSRGMLALLDITLLLLVP